jgi:hypothetical protein
VKLVSVVVPRDDADVLDAHLRFHLSAGVDLVLVGGEGDDEVGPILEPYVRGGQVMRAAGTSADLARLAVTEHGADWVLPTDADEFWWPRGESLKDVLAAIPPRYEIVQALVRIFLPPSDGRELFSEHMTVRPSLLQSGERGAEPLEWALRPLYRAGKGGSIAAGADEHRIPLRAWYPIEVLRYPIRSVEQARPRVSARGAPRSRLEAEAADANRAGRLAEWYAEAASGANQAEGLADRSLVEDVRLRDAIRVLGAQQPGESVPLVLTPPGVVDDASYAIECAAVGEVDLAKLERQIRELEGRIAWLEERFWPRVLRTVRRIVRR